MWCDTESVRKVIGITAEDASDEDLLFFITNAQQELLEEVTIPVKDGKVVGLIDGSNREFYLGFYPVADRDFDLEATTADVSVYSWTDTGDLDTKTSVTVESIDPLEGRIILSSPPSTSVEALTADYRYFTNEVTYDLLSEACIFLAAAKWTRSEFLMIPDSWTLGGIRIRHTRPYTELLSEYQSILSIIRRMPYRKGQVEPREILRRGLS